MDTLFDALIAGSLANSGGGGGGGGTDNYNALSNLPQINSTTLMGNKSSSDLGLQDTIDSSHKLSADLVSETSSKKFNVQADWEQTTDTAADYIKHKPTLGTASAKNTDYFATAAQGTKADSAIQGIKLNSSTITPSSAKVVSLTVDKTTVGLGNVTNNAQVKKISSSVTDNIVTWGAATGDTVKDSGVAIETSISADSDAKIPTSKAIATALSGKQDTLTFDGTYNASTNKAATESTVTNAINALDVSSVGGAGKYIESISEADGKISALVKTMDTTPTSDNTRAITSGGVYTALAGKQASLTTAQLNAVNSGITAEKLQADESALVELVDGGAKNVLQFDGMSSPSGSADNITFTYNSDGSITVNGYTTDAGTAYVYLRLNGSNINADTWCNGNYVLSGCPTNDSGLSLQARGTDYTKSESGTGVELTPYSGSGAVRITVMVAKSSTIDNLTIRPMICSKAAWDISQTYQPYRPSYQELYERVLALEAGT